ncbi:MAG: acyltransferase [Elusimicrobiota bacterium]|jgi:acetyltransferase-like isoleucine patch superfamily enzyme
MNEPFIHPKALVETADIGPGTRVWAFAQVMKGAKVGADCNICGYCFIEAGGVVGDGCVLKNGVLVWEGVTLEDGVFVGPAAVFTNDRWPRSRNVAATKARKLEDKGWLVKTRVRTGASIGARAVIVAGVELGEYCLVGAGAVVTKDVAPYSIVAGVPARPAGWVCACGLPLKPSRGKARCATCGAAYSLKGKVLRRTDGR